jgi:predicted nucleic acid-binding protein
VTVTNRDVYLDTSLVCAAVVRGSRYHVAARAYCEALVAGRIRVYMSQMLRIELLQAMRALATVPESLPGSIRRQFRLSHWGNDLEVRDAWMQTGLAQFEDWSNQFSEVYELSVDLPAWEQVAALMTRYHLNSYDALHAATAIEAGISTLATLDRDFSRVTRLNVEVIR